MVKDVGAPGVRFPDVTTRAAVDGDRRTPGATPGS